MNIGLRNRLVRAAKRGTHQILISGETKKDVREQAAIIKENGVEHGMRPATEILRSDVTGEWYQYWKSTPMRDRTPDEKRAYWAQKQRESRQRRARVEELNA